MNISVNSVLKISLNTEIIEISQSLTEKKLIRLKIFSTLDSHNYCEHMRVGIYARVSTHDQQTLPMQLEKMREYIENRKWKLTVEFEEVGSGAKTRPKREELLKMARRREIDAILVWKLDRFGRSMADLGNDA